MTTFPTTVPGTTTLGAALGPWACIVVGAGPAGAATSLRLARGGLRVLLVDRGGMPRVAGGTGGARHRARARSGGTLPGARTVCPHLV